MLGFDRGVVPGKAAREAALRIGTPFHNATIEYKRCCRPGFSPAVRRGICRARVAPGERQANSMAWPKFTNFKLGPGLNPGRHYLLIAAVALRHGVPMRVAEQRSKCGRGPRGLSEGERKNKRSRVEHSSPSSAAARVCEQRRGARRADEPGVAFLCLLSLAKQRKKVAAGQPPATLPAGIEILG